MIALLLNLNDLPPAIRQNFSKVQDFVRDSNILTAQFKHFEYTFTATQNNKQIPHKLGFLPQDLIQTFLTGSGTVTWNYSLFTDTLLDVTIGGTVTSTSPTVVRFLLGRYNNSGA